MADLRLSMSRSRRRRHSGIQTGFRVGVVMALVLGGMQLVTGVAEASGGGPSVFSSANDVAIPDETNSGDIQSTITISGLTGNITDVNVYVHLTGHMADLDGAVLAPNFMSDNTRFAYLFTQNRLSGESLGEDCSTNLTGFDDQQPDIIDAGTPPYDLNYKPSPNVPSPGPSPMSALNGLSPSDANGTWTLDFLNTGSAGVTINCWELEITTAEDGDQFFTNMSSVFKGPGHVSSPINVSGMVGSLSQISVTLWIQHPADADLDITLVAPNGKHVKLVPANTAHGQNFGNGCQSGHLTTFTDAASQSIASNLGPYLGSFHSADPLAGVVGLNGSNLNGEWDLEVTDTVVGHAGFLHCWSMSLGTSALLVQPRMSAPPLPTTYNSVGFYVTNTSDDTLTNVTATSTLPANITSIHAYPDSWPTCTVHLQTVTCTFASIAPHDTVVGGAIARTMTPVNGQYCFTASATATGVLQSSRSSCFAATSYPAPDHGNGYGIGRIAHNLRLRDQYGNPVSLYQFAGDYVLLQFTARWCGPSNAEVPQDRDEIAALNAGNVMGHPVIFLSVLINGANPGVAATQADALSWANHFHLGSSHVLSTQSDIKRIALNQHSTYSIMSGQPVEAFPTSVFIRPDGTIFDIRVGLHPAGDTTARFMQDLP